MFGRSYFELLVRSLSVCLTLEVRYSGHDVGMTLTAGLSLQCSCFYPVICVLLGPMADAE
jgi:hypothetical protein